MPLYPTTQYPAGTKAEVMNAIIHEKTVELGDDELRNRDILRWRKKSYFAVEPLPYFKPNKDELLPIPQQELSNNTKMAGAQNPGY